MDNFESSFNAIDQGYESEVAIFNGNFNEIDTPQFNLLNRNQYGKCCDFEREIIEYPGKKCYIPTKGYCFVKCIIFWLSEDYKQLYLDFIWNEKRPSNILTKANIQPFCRANNNNIGYFDGLKVFARSVTERNIALYLENNHFCLIWRSEGVSLNDVEKSDWKDKFKKIDTYITEENVKSLFKNIYIPKIIQSHLNIFITYDLETHNTDRARPYVFCFYRLGKIADGYNRDLTTYEIENY